MLRLVDGGVDTLADFCVNSDEASHLLHKQWALLYGRRQSEQRRLHRQGHEGRHRWIQALSKIVLAVCDLAVCMPSCGRDHLVTVSVMRHHRVNHVTKQWQGSSCDKDHHVTVCVM